MAPRRRKTSGPKKRILLSKEWVRACDDIACTLGTETVASRLSPFGATTEWGAIKALQSGARKIANSRKTILSFVPEAMECFAASHPPCRVRSIECMRLAILEVMAHWAFEEGHVPNPSVEFGIMRLSVSRYLKSLS